MTITVLIADDHPLFRRGLREVIEEDPRFLVVAEARNGVEAIDGIRKHRPTVAVLDISMPEADGFEVLKQCAGWSQRPKIVMLTMYDDCAEQAMQLGADGYLLKETAEDELVACLASVSVGESYVSERASWHPAGSGGALSVLTPTELRVLKLIAHLKTSREIGELLCVSHRTVQNHRANMCSKLDLKGDKALLRFALDHGEELSRL